MKIGDRVKCVDNTRLRGEKGTIIQILNRNSSWDYTVEFDNAVGGHTCGSKCKAEHGFWMYKRSLNLIEERPMTPRESVMF